MRRARTVLAAFAAFSLFALPGCSSGPGLVADGGYGIAQSALPVGDAVSWGSVSLCVADAHEVTVESVHFKEADHIAVRRFGVRSRFPAGEWGLGSSLKGIAAEGFDVRDLVVTTPCRAGDAAHTELGIDVVGAAPVGRGDTLVIGYRLGYRHLSTEYDLHAVVCSYSQERCPSW